MKQFYPLLIFSLLSLYTAVGQNDWQYIKVGGGSGSVSIGENYERVYDLQTDSQQNVYMLSTLTSAGDVDGNPLNFYDDPNWSDAYDIVLASFSCDGTFRWSKVIGGRGRDRLPYMEIDDQDNVYVFGMFAECQDQGYPPRIDNDIVLPQSQNNCQTLFMSKFETNGNMLWLKQPQIPGPSNIVLSRTGGRMLEMDDNGNLYWVLLLPVGSYFDGNLNVNQVTDEFDYYMAKIDPDGNLINATHLPLELGGGFGINFQFFLNPNNGNYYFTGEAYDSTDNALLDGQNVQNGFFLACFDTSGNMLWKRENSSSDYSPSIYNLDFDTNNNIYIGGRFVGIGLDSFLGFSIPETATPAFLMKTDATAENVQWVTYPSNPSQPSVSNSIRGGVVLNQATQEVALTTGAAFDGFTWGNQTLETPSQNGSNVLLARFDAATGNCIDLVDIDSDTGFSEIGTALAVDSAGDYLLGGQFEYNLIDKDGNPIFNGGAQSDFFVAKYATAACNPPLMSVASTALPQLNAYPNPAGQQLFLDGLEREYQYAVYDVQGRLVKQGRLGEQNNRIDVGSLTQGLYLVKLSSDDNGQVVRFVKE